jgi:hypothetical protein
MYLWLDHPEVGYEVVRVLELMLEQEKLLNLVQKLLMQKIPEDQPLAPLTQKIRQLDPPPCLIPRLLLALSPRAPMD